MVWIDAPPDPDGMVVCSPVAPTATAVRDPVVIFEVLSPSTAAKDRIHVGANEAPSVSVEIPALRVDDVNVQV
jgi:hypothetical protein